VAFAGGIGIFLAGEWKNFPRCHKNDSVGNSTKLCMVYYFILVIQGLNTDIINRYESVTNKETRRKG
jgi:hypothetical protein